MERTRSATTAATTAWAVVLLAGCWQSYQESADGGADGRVDADVVRESDADGRIDVDVIHDVDAEADAQDEADDARDADGGTDVEAETDRGGEVDAEADADSGGGCDGAWLDPTTGYLWEDSPPDTMETWDDAVAYCNGLTLCGYGAGTWRLPDIDELRSLIRGCPDTMTGGACGATDSCLERSCWSTACVGCGFISHSYCYWDGPLGGVCDWFWSSSFCVGSASDVWLLGFNTGRVNYYARRGTLAYVRCVHHGP